MKNSVAILLAFFIITKIHASDTSFQRGGWSQIDIEETCDLADSESFIDQED